MVGHLHLQAMEESLKGKSREGLLDSPDSGLPPSPSPPFCPLSPASEHHGYWKKDSREGKLLPYLLLSSQGVDVKSRMQPVEFGESIEVNPKPSTEIRFSSEVKYDSHRHFRDEVFCARVPTVTNYSETVVALQNRTWRNYKSEVHLEPRHRAVHYQSTAIIYPKHTCNTYRTTLRYNANGAGSRRFVSTVRLESSDDISPCIIYSEEL